MARTKHTRAEMLRDPNKRKNIPMSQLPPKYRAARQRRLDKEKARKAASAPSKPAATNPLLNPTVPLVGKNLDRAASAVANAAYRPQIATADRQIAGAEARTGALDERMGNIARDVGGADAAASGRMEAISNRVRENLAKIAQEGQNAVDATGQAAQAAIAGTPAGLEGSAAERLAAERGALSARQAGTSTAYRSSNEILSGVDERFQGAMGGINQARLAERRIAANLQQGNRVGELRSARMDLAARRSDTKADALTKLRQQSFENLVVGQELGIKQQDIAADAKAANAERKARAQEKAADRALRRQLARIQRDTTLTATEKREAAQSARDAANRRSRERIAAQRGKGSGPGGSAETRTSLQHGTAQDRIKGAESWARQAKSTGKVTRQEAGQALLRGLASAPKTTQLFASIALDMAWDGHVSARNVEELHRRGYSVKQLGLKTRGARVRRGGSSITRNAPLGRGGQARPT